MAAGKSTTAKPAPAKRSTKDSANSRVKTATRRATKPATGRATKRAATSEATIRSTTNAAGKFSAASTPSRLIDARIKELGDWRGETLSRIRTLIKQVIPDVLEEWKWRGVPVWYHDGMLCTGETYKAVVKVTFAKGAALADPSGLFNSSLGGNTRRAIDFRQGEKLDDKALKALFQAAADLNGRDLKREKRRH